MKQSLTLTSLVFLAAAPSSVALSQDQSASELPTSGTAVSAEAPDGAMVPELRPVTPRQNEPVVPFVEEGDVSPPDTQALQSRHDRLYFDHDGEAHWVRGRAYKASAGSDGFTYIPFLGSRASQNYPLSMRIARATVGGEALSIAAEATVTRAGAAFVLDRGPVDVRYDLELDSVEQTFVVETGSAVGDLVVTLDVATELVGAPQGGGFRFDGPEGGVDYGAATAFDGNGNALRIPAALNGRSLELTVPAAFVAQSNGEVVIDPIFASYQVFDNSSEVRDVDVGYCNPGNVFGYVFEDPFSLTDNDIYLATFGGNSGALEDGLYFDFTTQDANDPEVASLSAEGVFLCVWTRVVAAGDDPILGRIYDISTTSMIAGNFEIGDTGTLGGSWTNRRPDVGGNKSLTAGQLFLVTWERTFNTSNSRLPRFRTVDAAGNVGSLGTSLQGSGPDLRCSYVRVSESTGDAGVNVWNIAYGQDDVGTGDEVLRVAQINADGSLASGPGTALNQFSNDDFDNIDVSDAIEVDGADPTYLVVYDNFAAGFEDVNAVICRNASGVRSLDITTSEHGPAGANQNYPKVATTRDEFVVSYVELQSGEWHTIATHLDIVETNRLAIAERRLDLGPADPGSGTDGSPGMASRWAGGFGVSRYIGIGWDVNDTANGNFSVEGVTYFASAPFSPAWQYCDGTVNSTGERSFFQLEGDLSPSSSKTALASSLPPQQFCLMVCGDGFDIVPMAGGSQGTLCIGGNLGRYNNQIQQASLAGDASFTIDPQMIPTGIGFFSASAGDRYNFQVWHRDFVGGQTANFTNAVSIRFQ